MSETISFDFQFHYVLNKPERHSMDAMVFNSCEKQIVSSFYQLLELWGINKEDVVIDVLSREEGGVKVMRGGLVALIRRQRFFNERSDKSIT